MCVSLVYCFSLKTLKIIDRFINLWSRVCTRQAQIQGKVWLCVVGNIWEASGKMPNRDIPAASKGDSALFCGSLWQLWALWLRSQILKLFLNIKTLLLFSKVCAPNYWHGLNYLFWWESLFVYKLKRDALLFRVFRLFRLINMFLSMNGLIEHTITCNV